MRKKIIIANLLVAVVMILNSISVYAAMDPYWDKEYPVNLELNGKALGNDKATVYHERTIVPIRFLAEQMHYTVDYSVGDRPITMDPRASYKYLYEISNGIDSVRIEMTYNNVSYTYQDGKYLGKDREYYQRFPNVTYIALRPFTELFNCTIDYDEKTKTVKLYSDVIFDINKNNDLIAYTRTGVNTIKNVGSGVTISGVVRNTDATTTVNLSDGSTLNFDTKTGKQIS